jgi:hypothetical protein
MGTYCKLINVTKREEWEPPNIKPGGFAANADQIVALIMGPWRNDEVRFVTDAWEGGFWDQVEEDGEKGLPWPNRYDPEFINPSYPSLTNEWPLRTKGFR